MPSEPSLPRQVIREHLFEDTLHELITDAEEADDYSLAAEFVLARDPTIGQRTLDRDVWALPMAPIAGAQVALYYTFDDSTVYLLAIIAG